MLKRSYLLCYAKKKLLQTQMVSVMQRLSLRTFIITHYQCVRTYSKNMININITICMPSQTSCNVQLSENQYAMVEGRRPFAVSSINSSSAFFFKSQITFATYSSPSLQLDIQTSRRYRRRPIREASSAPSHSN